MRTSLPLLLALSLLAGCPTVNLQSIVIKDGSVSATGLTLAAQVTVEETEEVDPDGGSPNEGRAMMAIYLPRGWEVAAARMKSPQESTVRRLVPVPQAAIQYAEAFPKVPGQWWAFASNTQSVLTGTWQHEVELDLIFPKKSKGAELGVSVGILQDSMDEVPAPVVYDVKIKGKKATLTPRVAVPPPAPAPDPALGNNDKASAG